MSRASETYPAVSFVYVGAGFTFILLALRNEGSFEGFTLSFEGPRPSFFSFPWGPASQAPEKCI